MMQQLNKILVAVDLEDGTESVIEAAIMLGRAFDSSLLLLHVVPEVLPDTWTDELDQESLIAHLEKTKSGIEQRGVSVSSIAVLDGKASYRICQYAEQKSADLIVIAASRGRKAGVRLGVTGDRVLRNAAKPVWLVARPDGKVPSSILCPVDRSPAARRALQNAIRLAKRFEATLTVLRISESIPVIYAQMMPPDGTARFPKPQLMESELNALVHEFDVAGIDVRQQVREGIPHTEILSAASDLECDLIVMGTEGMSNQPRTLVGSVTKKVTRAMPCSIVTVNDEDVLVARLSNALNNIQEQMQEGAAQLRSGNPVEALAEYEQCLLDEPTYAPAWDGLAAAYEAMGDLNKADRCAKAAERIRGVKQP
jgi:universal stress protein E